MFTGKKTFLAKNMEWGIAIYIILLNQGNGLFQKNSKQGGGFRIQFAETPWNF